MHSENAQALSDVDVFYQRDKSWKRSMLPAPKGYGAAAAVADTLAIIAGGKNSFDIYVDTYYIISSCNVSADCNCSRYE